MGGPVSISVESPRGDRRIEVRDPSLPLSEILAGAGLPLNTRCNGKGLCRGCHVLAGDPPRADVLACQYRLAEGESLRIRIPARSLLAHPPSVVSEFRTAVPAGCDPLFDGGRPLGIAFDIGTTTVAALLVELVSGDVLATASALNAQVAMGDNVLTRIHLCQEDPSAVLRLRDALWEKTFAPLLREMLSASGASADDIAGIAVAGNTTMLHLAAGIDPTPMGMVPFTPAFLGTRRASGRDLGLSADLPVAMLPGFSAYVGSDIAAGAVCCGVRFDTRAHLLVDVGTNGEMLLCGPLGAVACATAAGPAFEGSGLLAGMRASAGVVGKIALDREPFGVRFETIGDPAAGTVPPGIAGSAYVDFLAEGTRVGLLGSTGRFDPEFPAAHPEWFVRDENGWCLLLSPEHPHLRIGEVDVALLLQAKAAIAAGVETLLARQGIAAADVGRLDLAGGFGLRMSVPNAIRCGLLPGFSEEQIRVVGNTSLGGAYLALLDRSMVAEMEDLRREVETVELNLDPGFEDRFLDHLSLG